MDEQDFLVQVKQLIRALYAKSMLKMTEIYEPYDLTPPQVSILMLLRHKKCLKVSELAALVHTADSNISVICRRLEQKKLIERRRDEADRRIVYIAATPQAEELYRLFDKNNQVMFKVIHQISAEDKAAIIDALTRLNETLEQALYSEKVR